LHNIAAANLALLRTHTKRFLNKYKIRISGGNKPEGKLQYAFYMKKGLYTLDPYASPSNAGYLHFDAINVPATPFIQVQNSPGNIQATLSSANSTLDLMLTTQFTGCCYCFMVSGTDLAAAHIDPQEAKTKIDGQHVSKQMRDHGGFSNGNGGTFKAYGRIADGSNLFGYPKAAQQMIVVAVKRSGSWRVYAQIDLGAHMDGKRIDVAE
jgi:hypothetical protein